MRIADLIAEPSIMALVVADTAWAFGVRDWAARRPARRRPIAYLRWRADETVLASEQVQLVAGAFEQRTPLSR